jgi:cytochrome c-type biogenesis protein CcmE
LNSELEGIAMSAIQKKLLVAGIALAAAVGYLAYAGMKSGWVYFLEVDHFLADAQYRDQRVRVHGKVSEENFSAANLNANFCLEGKAKTLTVAYQGVIPDMFQAGREVVVEGKLDANGTFKADILMTKCASKYEPASPHATADGGTKQTPQAAKEQS